MRGLNDYENWWSTVQENIIKAEYQVTKQQKTYLPKIKASYQAPNRRHNLRTYFTPEGIRVIPRNTTEPEWSWGLSLKRYGFKEDIKPVAEAKLSVAGTRVEYSRMDLPNLTEWYVNDERGLEQGFTLAAPPPKPEKTDIGPWVVFEMELYGNLKPNLAGTGKKTGFGEKIEFITTGGVGVMNYGELLAEDAAGRKLPAKLAL